MGARALVRALEAQFQQGAAEGGPPQADDESQGFAKNPVYDAVVSNLSRYHHLTDKDIKNIIRMDNDPVQKLKLDDCRENGHLTEQ